MNPALSTFKRPLIFIIISNNAPEFKLLLLNGKIIRLIRAVFIYSNYLA